MAHFTPARSLHPLSSLQMPISPILAILLFALFSLAWIAPPGAFALFHRLRTPNNNTAPPPPHTTGFHPSKFLPIPRPRKIVTEPRDTTVTKAPGPASPAS